MTGGAQVHWQTGQGDRERRGGDEGLGLGQRDPEGEMGGRVDKDRGETGREEEASWATTDSLLCEAATEGKAVSEVEIGSGTGSDRLGATEEGAGVRLVGVVGGLRGAAAWQDSSEVDPDNVPGSAC